MNVIISHHTHLFRLLDALCYIKIRFFALDLALFLFAQVPLASAAVVTSMKPLGFIAAAIADGVTETRVLLPDGASEHDYSLRPSDVKRLQNADLVVWIGPEMEAFMDKSTQSIAANKR